MSNIYEHNSSISREYASNKLKDNKKESINKTPENEKESNKRCILSLLLLAKKEKGISSVKTVDTNFNKCLNYNH